MANQKERLIELLSSCPTDPEGNRNVALIAQHLLDNRVIVLPCKVGATLYGIKKFKSTGRKTVYSFTAPDIAWIIEHMSAFGKSIFLNREEAEKVLKESNNAAD